MWLLLINFLTNILLIQCQSSIDAKDDFLYGTFPDGFMWGTATASYQVEGGANEGGRVETIWDTYSHTPGNIDDGSTGDVACDSYHKYKEDVKLLAELNVTHYRFSIAWSRIFSNPESATKNQEGIDYYNNLINELVANKIVPFVTLYHWDLPQSLQDSGGWLDQGIVDHYAAYARACFEEFGDRVKWWLTFNEPWCTTVLGYGNGEQAPGQSSPGDLPYKGAHNILKAHAKAYHIYDQEFRNSQGGKLGITLNTNWNEPASQDQADIDASDRQMHFSFGWFANPIYSSNGDYPDIMKKLVGEKSSAEGLPESRLPSFTADEIASLKGTGDFIGLNMYTSSLVKNNPNDPQQQSYFSDSETSGSQDPNWPSSGSSWLKVTPWGIRKCLKWIKDAYNNPMVIITENGFSDRTGQLDDPDRANFYRDYIDETLKAIKLDGCNVAGYTAWSLMDNFEWSRRYTEKFGMTFVDFNDPGRPRTPKSSYNFFRKVIADNGFPQPPQNDLDNDVNK